MTNPHDEQLVYRPKAAVGVAFASVFFVTGGILLWLGWILTPADVAAMDGFNLLLFTVIPIPLFCWCMSVAFAALGLLILHRSLRRAATLTLTEDTITLADQRTILVQEIDRVEASETELVLKMPATHHIKRLAFSAFALGESPILVKQQFDARMPSPRDDAAE